LLVLPASVLLFGWRNAGSAVLVIVGTAVAGVALFDIFSWVSPGPTAEAAASAGLRDWSGLTFREGVWQMSGEAISKAPLLGIVPMQFATLDNRVGAHPHNWVMQVAAEWGVPALLLLFALVLLARAMPQAATFDSTVVPAALALGVGLANGLVDGNLVMPVSQSAFALAGGLMLAAILRAQENSVTHPISLAKSLVSFGAATLAAAAVVAFAVFSFSDQANGVSRFQQTQPGAWLLPRFWEQGLLF